MLKKVQKNRSTAVRAQACAIVQVGGQVKGTAHVLVYREIEYQADSCHGHEVAGGKSHFKTESHCRRDDDDDDDVASDAA
jgi:hypothetical protein